MFWLESIEFLGNVVSVENIRVYPTKIEAICGWDRPTSVIEVRSFVGLGSYYKRFGEGFSTFAVSLTWMTHQYVLSIW